MYDVLLKSHVLESHPLNESTLNFSIHLGRLKVDVMQVTRVISNKIMLLYSYFYNILGSR